MCGFGGLLDPRHGLTQTGLEALATRMGGALLHRGPDAGGTWCDPEAGIAFGHRRLSILDLSGAGDQPMHSASGRYVLSYNGEIYNFPELRRALAAEGAAFRGHSDTEVLLAAAEHWGLGPALKRVVGMFALALWDRDERTLTLARDRFGEKPLYYGRVAGAFVFGSELKALRQHPGWTGEVDRRALGSYLRLGWVPGPHSIFEGVRKLDPGTLLNVRAGDAGESRPEPFWSALDAMDAARRDPFRGTEAEAAELLEETLRTAVRGQMLADVPLGAFLSGGVDSSTVVALMQAESQRPVRTFTIGFQERAFDEAPHARAVAAALGTEHTELYLDGNDALALVPSLPSVYDEPFADMSQLPVMLVSRLAREHVTVALSGDGGDELFAGYDRYELGARLWRSARTVPRSVRRWAGRALGGPLPDALQGALRALGAAVPQALLRMELPHRSRKLGAALDASDVAGVYSGIVSCWPDPRQIVVGAGEYPLRPEAAGLPDFADPRETMMYLDTVGYLADDILVKVDRAAMAYSLEVRAPLLDHRVFELAWRLPLGMKMRDGRGKHLLRQVLYRHVPRELVDRPKAGFRAPVGSWLRGPLHDWAEELLATDRLQREGYLRPDPIRRVWADHQSGVRSAPFPLWHILMFQAWLQEEESRLAGTRS